jgi:hypothetical protein
MDAAATAVAMETDHRVLHQGAHDISSTMVEVNGQK